MTGGIAWSARVDRGFEHREGGPDIRTAQGADIADVHRGPPACVKQKRRYTDGAAGCQPATPLAYRLYSISRLSGPSWALLRVPREVLRASRESTRAECWVCRPRLSCRAYRGSGQLVF